MSSSPRTTLTFKTHYLQDLLANVPALRSEAKLIRMAEKDRNFFLELRDQRLAAMIQHAFTRCPFYQDIYDEARVSSFSGVGDLAALPLILRRDLQQRLNDFKARGMPLSETFWAKTSGSTGEPLKVIKDRLSNHFYSLIIQLATERFGIKVPFFPFRTSVVMFTGLEEPESGTALLPILRFSRFYKIGLGDRVWDSPEEVLEFLSRIKDLVLSSDPASLEKLIEHSAKHDRESRYPVRPRFIYSTSRPLLPATRERIEQHFGCPIVDIYSIAELGPVAMKCPAGEGFHVEGLATVVECLRPDGTSTEPGELGEFVLTNLRNPFFPLIRYRVGDFGTMIDGECSCGSTFPRFDSMISRAGVMFVRANGTRFEPPILIRKVCELPLHQYQVEQTDIDRFIFRYPPSDDSDPVMVSQKIKADFDKVLESSVVVDCIPVSSFGDPARKVQPYICHLK